MTEQIKSKIRQLYTFLKEANQLRYRPVRQLAGNEFVIRLSEMPPHPALQIFRPTVTEGNETLVSDTIIKITRARLSNCPVPPISIEEWLIQGWDDPNKAPLFSEGLNRVKIEMFSDSPERVAAYNEFAVLVKNSSNGEPVKPSSILDYWLDSDAVAAGDCPSHIEAREVTVTEKFSDDPQRLADRDEWISKRSDWVGPELLAREALKYYEKFYDAYAALEKDGEQLEVVIADGRLQWTTMSEVDGPVSIDHPVLLKRVELKFEPDVPQFVVSDTERESELYSSLFIDLTEIVPASIRNRSDELAKAGYHPFGWDDTSAFLRALVQSLSPTSAEFLDEPTTKPISESPRLFRDMVLIVRKRNAGISNVVNSIIEDVDRQTVFPPSLELVTGEDSSWNSLSSTTGYGDDTTSMETARASTDVDILLAKEANEEQLQIIRKLNKSGSVIVQGPPGTGKTHTIGNLIGHLLSQGKSILVTAQTSKALRVVRDKVPDVLRPLAVSVLGSDQTARQQLETSIGLITERMTADSAESLLEKAAGYASQRAAMLNTKQQLATKLRQALENEYRDIKFGNHSFSPSDAAKHVNKFVSIDSWIPSPVVIGADLPLSSEDLTKLYALGTHITSEEENDSRQPLPDLDQLPNERAFGLISSEYQSLTSSDLTFGKDKWTSPGQGSSATLSVLAEALEREFTDELRTQYWRPYAIVAGILGGTSKFVWEKLIENIEETSELQAQYNLHINHAPEVVLDQTIYVQKKVVEEICEHIESGGKLGFLQLVTRSEWKQFLKGVTVSSGAPDHLDHFKAVKSLIDLRHSRQLLGMAWDQLIGNHIEMGFDRLGANPEQACRALTPDIRRCLEWYESTWLPLKSGLSAEGVNVDSLLATIPRTPNEITEYLVISTLATEILPLILSTEIKRRKLRECEEGFDAAQSLFNSLDPRSRNVGVVGRIVDAINSRNRSAYEDALAYLRRLHSVKEIVSERDCLLGKLRAVAPVWAEQISCRVSPHDVGVLPGDAKNAWIWRQLNDALVERDSLNANAVQDEINKLDLIIRELTLLLIDAKSWGNQLERLRRDNSIRQALVGWLDTTKRLLSTRQQDKRQTLMSESRKLMKKCADSVPVWVMPISIVAESFDPASTRFDVVIIDEASQADLNALIPMYLAKQIIIVGDHEQVTPLGVGQGQTMLDNLRKQTLTDIPNAHLFDSKFSIYDIGRQSFGDGIRLVEHFRCVPEIIGFSNKLSYDGAIKPLRESNSSLLKPACVSCHVDGTRIGNVNNEEARRIVDLIKAMILHPKYENKTIGVIPMVGNDQTFAIQSLIHKEISATEIEERRIQVGISSEFQGDERDIILLSMVDSPDGEGPMRLTGEGAFELTKKRYNVAASRARDQMFVVHSFDPDLHLKPGDLRLELLRHVKDPFASLNAYEVASPRTESHFERAVLKILTDAGYKVVTQWQVGYYRIDMVVEGGGKRLAVECDGDRFHPLDKLADDIERQTILERLGWEFVRIRGSAFYRDQHLAMEPVFKRLEELELPKEAHSTFENTDDYSLIYELDQIISTGFIDAEDSESVGSSATHASSNDVDQFASNEFNGFAVDQNDIIQLVIANGGVVRLENLIKELSVHRGFARLGKNVRTQISGEIDALASSGAIRIESGFVRYPSNG